MIQELVDNKYQLEEKDITHVSRRAKVLLINARGELLMGYSNHTYQFIGGHMEENETYDSAIQREVLEETGITIHDSIEPFFCRMGYYKDYPAKGFNQKKYIYYGIYYTDQMPRIDLTHYTEEEIEKEFTLCYVPLELVEEILKKNKKEFQESTWIENEMLYLFENFREIIYGKKNEN